MPRVKSQSPISLFKLCAEFIARNLDDWCNPSDTELNMCNQEANCSPFDKLPSVLLEEVINFVRQLLKASSSPLSPDKMILKKQSLELLITPHSKSLDLSMAELNDVPHILNLASLRSPDLQTVRIVSSCNCLDIFVHLCAMKFKRLQALNISETDAGDNCLKILGMYCKDLRELNVRGCKKITDAGIQRLCVSVNHLGKEDQTLGQYKSIETLIIGGTRITKKGIQIALINLPFLKQLPTDYYYAVLVQFLAEIHQPDWNIKRLKDIRKYSLESLNLAWLPYDFPYISGSLGLVASLCPLVTSVGVEFITGLTDSDLLGLLSLKNVNKLDIRGRYDVNTTVTYEGGMVPLLKGFGSSLKELGLAHLKDVNIRAIIDFCPKLQSLRLDENESYTTVSAKDYAEPYHYSKRCKMEPKPSVLKNLKKLFVMCPHESENPSEEENISSEDFLSLLSSPSVVDITILDSDNLTDYIFERASEIHQFLSLENLTLYFCHYLTRRGIDVVMNNKTPLKAIEIYSCDNITEDDIDLLISNANSKKWELSIMHNDYGLVYCQHFLNTKKDFLNAHRSLEMISFN